MDNKRKWWEDPDPAATFDPAEIAVVPEADVSAEAADPATLAAEIEQHRQERKRRFGGGGEQ
jgi:hypothetical protein